VAVIAFATMAVLSLMWWTLSPFLGRVYTGVRLAESLIGRILGRLLEQRAHIPRPTCGPSRPSVCCWASAVCHEGSALLMKGHEAEARSLLPPGQNLEQIREVLRPLLKAVVADDQLQTALAQQQTLGREGPRGQGPPHQAEDRHRGEGDDAAADDTGDGRILGRLLELGRVYTGVRLAESLILWKFTGWGSYFTSVPAGQFAPGEEPDQHRQRRGDEAEPDARFVDREEHERLPVPVPGAGLHRRSPRREPDPVEVHGLGQLLHERGEGDDAAADDTGDGRILGRLLEQRAHIPRPTCGSA
jgi:hypothetical protein